MSSINDDTKGFIAAPLAAGVDTVSQDQGITFTQFVRVVLPLDGFVFWVRADLLSPSALFAAMGFNSATLNKVTVTTPAATFQAPGSFHFATTTDQQEDETAGVNNVIFTSEVEVQNLNDINPNVMWIAVWKDIEFAFNQRGSFYRQAALYHYRGKAVMPALKSQVIQSVEDLDTREIVVSNSLPIWLAMDPSNPPVPSFLPPGQRIPLYPSYLVPSNIQPPYGAVHVVPDSLQPIQAAPVVDREGNQWQLVQERVKVTLYGARNFNVLDFIAFVQLYAENTDTLGIMNMPVPRDEKRTQSELGVIAMKKTIEFQVNYYQTRVRNLARQIIKSAIPTYIIPGQPIINSTIKPGVYGEAIYGQSVFGSN